MRQFAAEYAVTLSAEGAGTVIAAPDGAIWLNRTGNAGMAKGGSGDVLAGMIASFAAQGNPLYRSGGNRCLSAWAGR